MKKLLIPVLLLSFPACLTAQQGTSGIDGVQFVAPMQIAVGRDDNFLVDRTGVDEKQLVLSLPASIQPGAPDLKPAVLDDQFLLLRLPKIAYQNGGRRYEFAATWVPEFEIFQHNSDQNAFNQQGFAAFGYFPARNVQLSVGDAFSTSHDAARTLQNVFVLLPRGKYKQNDFRASIEFQPARRTSISARYDAAYNVFGQTDPFQLRIFDTRAKGYTFIVSRLLKRTHRIRGVYSIFKTSPINRQREFDDAVDTTQPFEHFIHAGGLQYRFNLNRNTVIGAAGGIAVQNNSTDYTFRGSIERRFKTVYTITGAFARTFAFLTATPTTFAPGLRANAFNDVVIVRFRGEPTRKVGVLFDSTMFRAAGTDNGRGNGLMARARFDYRLSERKVFFTSLESYQQSRNVWVDAPLSRNRFTVGIEISLASDSQRRTNPLNEDADYVALTDHPRRRTDTQ